MSKKHTIEYVRKYIEGFGYVLLSKIYVNALSKLRVRCPKGHEYEVCFSDFKNGNRRCAICAGKKKHTIDHVRKCYKDEDHTYLSTKYKNAHTKELVQCPEGHQYEVSFANFRQGKRCPVCAIKIVSEKQKHDYEYVRKYIEGFGYVLLSKVYVNNNTKLLVQCPEGHQYEVKFANFQQGKRCPICNNEKTSSKAEIEIQELVKTLTNNVICNDRTQIVNTNTGHYLELDIYLPDLKKAIEYNGSYWHSSKEAKMKDKMKVDQCKNLNIDLLVINEADYLNNEEQIKNKIKQWLLE